MWTSLLPCLLLIETVSALYRLGLHDSQQSGKKTFLNFTMSESYPVFNRFLKIPFRKINMPLRSFTLF